MLYKYIRAQVWLYIIAARCSERKRGEKESADEDSVRERARRGGSAPERMNGLLNGKNGEEEEGNRATSGAESIAREIKI